MMLSVRRGRTARLASSLTGRNCARLLLRESHRTSDTERETMKLSVVRASIVAILVAVLCYPVDSPVRAQQGACATQIGPRKPDLIVDQKLLSSQIFLATENVRAGRCTIMEGCVTSA